MSQKEVKEWITINHNHIPIYEGESRQDAYNRSIALMNENKKNTDIERNKQEADKLNGKKILRSISDSEQLDAVLSGNGIEAKELVDRVDYTKHSKFRKFKDKASDSGASLSERFVGDYGEDEWEYMKENSNFDSLIREAEKNNDADAFKSWTQGDFMFGQQYKGFSNMTEQDQKTTRTLDKYLDKSVLNEGIIVNRRAKPQLLGNFKYNDNPDAKDLQSLRGSVIVSKGNMSACAAKEGLLIGSPDNEKFIEYKIHIPAGAKGAGMWVGDERINHWKAKQREFLMNRDSVFIVGDIKDNERKYYSTIDGDEVYEPFTTVNLYYIGRLPHDYS